MIMRDTQLIAIWQEFTQRLQSNITSKGAAQELRVMSEIHQELVRRGYESQGGNWSKSKPRQAM